MNDNILSAVFMYPSLRIRVTRYYRWQYFYVNKTPFTAVTVEKKIFRHVSIKQLNCV